MAKAFTEAEWREIHRRFDGAAGDYGLPERRAGSVVLGSFNIRKLGAVKNKSGGAWDFLANICAPFDLLAVQEVQDDLSGLRALKARLGDKYGMVVSDVTGNLPGSKGSPERLAFLFRWDIVERTELASDITYDRDAVVGALIDHWQAFAHAFATAPVKNGRKTPKLPHFLTFIRQPHCASFRIGKGPNAYEFLAVNAHLLFGEEPSERFDEFKALVGWLINRARTAKTRMYHRNIVAFGDWNLDFDAPATDRAKIDTHLKSLNKATLKEAKDVAWFNFPFLTAHPVRGQARTNARLSETYDHIAFVAWDDWAPLHDRNGEAGKTGPDGYDYGVFRFVDLFAVALHGATFEKLGKPERAALIEKFEHDLSDHMPIWVRLPKPS